VTAEQLVATGVRVRRASRWILDGIDLTASGGGICGVTGPSGSGKSTLLFVLGALIDPDEGHVTLDGSPLKGNEKDYRSRSAMVFQTYGLAHSLTAEENIAIPMQARGLTRVEIARVTEETLTAIGLDGLGHHLVDELSGGQQQRVAVARALALQPDVLLADEPTAELDTETRELVLSLLTRHVSRGGIVVLATHDPEVMSICETVVELADGRVANAKHVSVSPPRDDGPDDMSIFTRPLADAGSVARAGREPTVKEPALVASGARAGDVLAEVAEPFSGPTAPVHPEAPDTPHGLAAAGHRRRRQVALAIVCALGLAGVASYVSLTNVGSGPRAVTLPRMMPLSDSVLVVDGQSLTFSQTGAPRVTFVGPGIAAFAAGADKRVPIASVSLPGGHAAMLAGLRPPDAAALSDGEIAAIVTPREGGEQSSGPVELFTPGSTVVRKLGTASGVFAGSAPASVWLISPRSAGSAGTGCTVEEVSVTGKVLVATKPIPCAWTVAGSNSNGLIVLESPTKQGAPTLHLWDPASGHDETIASLPAHEYVSVSGNTYAFASGGGCATSCSLTTGSVGGTSSTLSLRAKAPMNFLEFAASTFSLSPDGSLIAVEELPFYMQPTGNTGNPATQNCSYVQYCMLRVTGGAIALFDATTGQLVGERKLSYLIGGGPPVWSPDGAYIFVPAGEQSIDAVPMWSMSAPVTSYNLTTTSSAIWLGSIDFAVSRAAAPPK
jgi:putative ABC transport system ATP-binding protein